MLAWAGMVVSVSEVGRASGESRRGEGPTQAKRGGGVVVEWCGRAGVEGKKTTGAPETSFRPCLVPRKFCKIFHIPRHIESLDACMKY